MRKRNFRNMRSTSIALALASGVMICPGEVAAQDAAATAPGDVAAGPSPVADASPTPTQRWLKRFLPQPWTGEFGGFFGLLMPSRSHNFHDETRPQQPVNPAGPSFGLRGGYYPLSYLGGELEGALAPTSTDDGVGATLWALRMHVVAQLPLWRITPLVLVGGGRLGLLSNQNGNDADPAFHFGAGVRFALTDLLSVRVDLRDTLTQKNEASPGDLTGHPEILSSLAVRFYSPTSQRWVQPPPADVTDLDSDGFVGEADRCPNDPGGSPDGCPDPDGDFDGFPDRIDACPAEPGVAPNGCPVRDADGDGLSDSNDRCPERAGAEPDGCPPKDADLDEIVDSADRCPVQPETRNGFEDGDGCPDSIPEKIRGILGVVEGIQFAGGKDTLRPESHVELDTIADALGEYPQVRILITAHTDGRGTREYNLDLSRRRAEAIKGYLVDHGVAADRIDVHGAGAEKPVADNSTAAGRRRNRRIEIRLAPEHELGHGDPPGADSVNAAPF